MERHQRRPDETIRTGTGGGRQELRQRCARHRFERISGSAWQAQGQAQRRHVRRKLMSDREAESGGGERPGGGHAAGRMPVVGQRSGRRLHQRHGLHRRAGRDYVLQRHGLHGPVPRRER